MSEGPDVVARQRAHESLQAEIRAMEVEIDSAHRKELEEGAILRLNEREAALGNQRAKVLAEMEEEERVSIKTLSDNLSRDASKQIEDFRRELEELREARTVSALAKEKETTEILVQVSSLSSRRLSSFVHTCVWRPLFTHVHAQELKANFMKQAVAEIEVVSRGSEEDVDYALHQVRDEVGRFQALKATEITTNARSMRAARLPRMAIELEERAEGIEREFRRGLLTEDCKEEREIMDRATDELREHVYGAREAVLEDNELFVREVTEEFMKARGRVLRARAEYLKVPVGGVGESSAPPQNVRTLVEQFEQLRTRHLATGTRVTDANMEKVLLEYEVKAARVRRAEGKKMTEKSGHSRSHGGGRKGRECPTCKPLTEANLELQRVASNMRQRSSSGAGERSRGGGTRLSEASLRSKYGGGEVRGGGKSSPGAESASSAGSGREAEFVKRFLGKVTKSSSTLRGTLAMLNGEGEGGGGREERWEEEDREGNLSSGGEPTAFDDLISRTLESSVIDSHLSVAQKKRMDEQLVKSLLDVSVVAGEGRGGEGETPVLLQRGGGAGEFSFGSGGGGGGRGAGLDRSFEKSPAVMAPALSINSVNDWVEGGTRGERSFRVIDSGSEDDSGEVI